MSDYLQHFILRRHGCRRCKIERRVFSYSAHIPERRCGQDRRRVKEPAPFGRRGAFGNTRQDGFQPATRPRIHKPGAWLTTWPAWLHGHRMSAAEKRPARFWTTPRRTATAWTWPAWTLPRRFNSAWGTSDSARFTKITWGSRNSERKYLSGYRFRKV